MKSRQSAAVHPVTAFPRAPVITLLTDFGTADYFVAAMKGVILSRNPQACITDITHEIPPQDIEAGAFILLTACSFFPPGTIHVAVIDPGVGSSRKPILIEAGGQFFVGPDNGLFSYVCDRLPVTRILHLTNAKYFLEPVSQTFNGRDIFAPVAAALSTGIKPQELGTETTDYVRLKSLAPETSRDGEINARVIHIDRFGNCVTNITRNELSPEQINAGATLRIKGKTIKSFRNYFNEKTASRDKVFAVWGSAGFLEIAAANQSAAKLLNIQRGDSLIVR
jgi:S-adenosyl-L-methionine hydrolase (adenosine-forming)